MGEQKSLDEIISDITILLGIPPNVIGSMYINTAVKLAIEKPEILMSITKELYPTVAEKYKTRTANVERAIRHAIDIAWGKEKLVVLNDIFNLRIYNKRERPCNSEFIALLSERIPYLMQKNSG